MESLHKDLVMKTTQNIHKRILNEQNHQKAHNDNMTTAIDRVYHDVIGSFSENQISSIADSGYNKYTLYTFGYKNTIEQSDSHFPLVFLFKGPRVDKGNGWGEQFFENIGVESIMKRLVRHFSPLTVQLVNNKKLQQYMVQLVW